MITHASRKHDPRLTSLDDEGAVHRSEPIPLLHQNRMLQKHGRRYRIDLAEARRLAALDDRISG
jgi:hypothetical protein